MPLQISALSRVCRSIADFVGAELEAASNSIRILIGTPSDAAKVDTDKHRINFFFYRFEPSGFGPGPAPEEIWSLRIHCLITAFGILEEQVSAGENDLRLLGEVLLLFHGNPVLPLLDVEGESVRLQAVFQPLSLDEVNHLWSTQGEVSYRPSVAYEMALAPMVPREPAIGDPMVGMLGSELRSRLDARREPFSGVAAPPPVRASRVDPTVEDWAPQLCLVRDGLCHHSFSLEVDASLAAWTPQVWIAGKVGSTVTLHWEIWDRASGWSAAPGPLPATASSLGIEPEAADSATTAAVPLPFNDRAGQAVLHAERSYTRELDGAQLTVRSNPLVVSLYEGLA